MRYFSEISSELVEHRAQSPFREVKMLAIWPSIAEGFLTTRLRVTYYTMKNCRLSYSLIVETKRHVIPATKSFYKYLKIFFAIHYISRMFSCESVLGKISVQPHPTLCIQFLNRENNDKNNTFPLGKQICFTMVWGCAETLPSPSAIEGQTANILTSRTGLCAI